MVDFISEVEEELRKDDYNKFLRKYGPYIIGLLIALVMAVAYVEWRDYSVDRTARAASLSYLEADELLQEERYDEARAAFLALADVAPDGYAGLSLMRAAIIAAEQGNDAEAIRLYDAASARFDLDRHSQLAQLKAAYIVANQGNWADVEQRASGLAAQGAPYEYLARELLATALLNQDNDEAARAELAYLDTIPGVPETVSRRAEQALVLLNTASSTPDLSVPDDTSEPVPTLPDADSESDAETGDDQ
ncbi:MAG: tetratricopeptide repeat protein [Pseudomonadota bacterium]